MRKILIALLLLAAAGGISWLVYSRTKAAAVDAHSDEAGKTETVARRDISSSIRATGIIKPQVGAEVRVGSRISGVVRRLYVGVGDTVSQGQTLAELDATDLAARLHQAEAALDMAQAQLDYAALDLERKRELARTQIVSSTELDLAENAHRVAELRVAEAEANRDYSKTQIGYATIRSPISGVVSSVTTQEGETVAASFTTPTFVTIIDLDRLELQAYIDETDIGRVSPNQPAEFTVDTYPEAEFTGTVLSVYPDAVVENTVVNYVTIIAIDDPQGKTLRPEMTASVTLLLETRENVLSVPRAAVQRSGGRYVVQLLRDGVLEEQEVRVGWRDDQYTEIVEGLEDGDKVVVNRP